MAGAPPPGGMGFVDLSAPPFAAVDNYDRPYSPELRPRFLEYWIGQPGCSALGIMHDGELAVPATRSARCMRQPGTGRLPLPGTESGADPAAPAFLDIPKVNEAAMALAGRHTMRISFETAMMYTGKAPDIPLKCRYGVASFEVG